MRRKSVRIIAVVMVIGKVTVRAISAYAPQKNRKDEEKVQFYDDVSEENRQAGLDEFVMPWGDLIGHVELGTNGYEGVYGECIYGLRTEEGCRVLELADAHSTVMGILCLRGNQHD